jgi:hypothetical protein
MIGATALLTAAGFGFSPLMGHTERANAAPACTTTLNSSMDVVAAVNQQPENAVICFAAGTYRLSHAINPRQGQTLRGQQGTIITGAVVLSNWAPQGSLYVASGYLPAPYAGVGQCEDLSWNPCLYYEDLFLNGAQLRRVQNASAVTSGTFYADYTNNKIYVSSAPATGSAELSLTHTAITSTAANVTVESLTVQDFASVPQQGAISV